MSDTWVPSERLQTLAKMACYDDLPPEEGAELETFLGDRRACRWYRDFCLFHTELRFLARAARADDAAHEQIWRSAARQASSIPHMSEPPTSGLPLPIVLEPPFSASQTTFLAGWPIAYLVATVIVGVGLVIGAIVHVSQPEQNVRSPDAHGDPNAPSAIRESSSIVARITGMADCVWEGSGFRGQGAAAADHNPEIRNQKSLLHLGDRLSLRSGLLELTYDTGARVILQGPVAYEVESPAGGYLAVGKLTAKLEKKSEVRGQRSESANHQSEIINQKFVVRTPTAVVTDLGTEFGVEVDRQGGTKSYVFRGEIQVQAPRGIHGSTGTIRLKGHESAVIDPSGVLWTRQAVDGRQFVRRLAQDPFRGIVDLSQGVVVFEEPFATKSTAPTVDYPALRFDPIEMGLGKSRSANASVLDGALRLCRESVAATPAAFAAETDTVTTIKKFSGKLVVSVDIGADSQNCGECHVALQLGDLAFLFHAGHCTRQGIRGLFYISKSGRLVVPATDLGFVPDVDILHHMSVYYDGKDTFYVCLVDGLDPRRVFRTTYIDSGRSNEPFTVGVYRSGHPNVGLFDNLRVVQTPMTVNESAAAMQKERLPDSTTKNANRND